MKPMIPHRRNRTDLPPYQREQMIRRALGELRLSRDILRRCGANNAADYVARAIKSVDGALRHAKHRSNRT